MLLVLSPAKSLNYDHDIQGLQLPYFRKQSLEIIELVKPKKDHDLMKLMGISQDLANLNVARFKNYSSRFTEKNSRAAIYTFNGDVYRGLDIHSLNDKDLLFAEKHVRILSGLYGLLQPMDKMQPYRLEMGTSLKNEKGNTLYKFWGDSISKKLTKDLKGTENKVLVNLASKEYFSAIDKKALKYPILNIEFKELRNGVLKVISFNAKRARGLMTRFIIEHKINDPELLKGFDVEGYHFDESKSTNTHWLFTK